MYCTQQISFKSAKLHGLSGLFWIQLCRYQFHPKPSPRPRDTTRRGQKPSPRDNHCVQNPSPRDKTGSQKPHPQHIKLENFTNISINSDTI